MRKEYEVCTHPGCGRPHKARGYCQTHYMQFRRGVSAIGEIRSRVRDKPPACIEDGCAEPVKAKGLCKTHYQRLLRHGHTRYTERKTPPKPCAIPSCDNHAYARGLCHAHYLKQRKWREFGVDAQRYQDMLHEQNGCCAICRQPERAPDKASGKIRDLAIDHDHETGAVRALLCSSCNTALGLFRDDPALLGAAKEYLAKHLATPV
jgi:Recombination endonuclease VII